ncbi:hypothetical protein QNI23_016610 [Bermanella sp. WJH001]|uniref:hypothetical protein n=1 Tax=Bermanella sp. WJH001 TaxID=3048005 RepID=UPI0024BE3CBC|nr:hypothetical protein [Bermanella sp. WJH001]MDJ1538934.1 hypothetical protein [Bermanella sp. WJH001]
MKTIILILATLLSFNSNADLAFNIKLPFKNIYIHIIEDNGDSTNDEVYGVLLKKLVLVLGVKIN